MMIAAPLMAGELLAALPDYAEMLEACVADGASIGFLHPMPAGEAEDFWRGIARGVEAGDILLWSVADEDGVVVGTIQLHPVGKPNGAHRAEIAKLMVHPRARGRGLAKMLMQTAEDAASGLGRRLLVLDTVEGGVADGLYRRLGWTEAGKIPDFALKSGGGSEATVVFWKRL